MNKLTEKSDKLLLLMMAKDSEKAFEELYIRYKNKIYSFCNFLLKTPELSRDITQDIFAMIWENRKTINSHQSFSSFLYTTARNRALNELRSASFREKIDLETADQQELLVEENMETSRISQELHILLDKAIDSLSEQRRQIFLMSRKKGLTYKEIGKCMGISPHTVQAHITISMNSIRNFVLEKANFILLIGSVVLSFFN
ncbi:RNA polymerase sigma-70 factor, expansion family 1 [Petrimonas sp. IBARAKI]|nr:RNA polymerase sigma-70 factor, expansion family 1 [Petrimonas sp. IBARAKI]